jgi:hypothetical protein
MNFLSSLKISGKSSKTVIDKRNAPLKARINLSPAAVLGLSTEATKIPKKAPKRGSVCINISGRIM